jgi:hypothetical protein
MSYSLSNENTGDVTSRFSTYTSEKNKEELRQAFKESGERLQVNETLQDAIANYAATVKCG